MTHGCSKKDKSRPYFVRFAFPNKDCTEWIDQIDLIKKFPDVVAEFYAPIVAAEAEQRRVKLRKGIKRGGREKQACRSALAPQRRPKRLSDAPESKAAPWQSCG